MSGDGVERQLQTLIGVFLVAGFSGFVIDDGDVTVGTAVDAVDAADNDRLPDVDFERFLSLQDLGSRNPLSFSQELGELSDSQLLVELSLVNILKIGSGEVEAEEIDELLGGLGPTQAHGIKVGFEHAMNRGTVLHGGGRLGGDAPVALELELQAAAFVGVDGGGAKAPVQTIEHRQLEPGCGLRLGWV